MLGELTEAETRAHWRQRLGLTDDQVDELVYSLEVGLKKPDPAIYELTRSRLAVEPGEIAFLDDVPENVEAARAAGWCAVLHEDTERSIAEIEALFTGHGG